MTDYRYLVFSGGGAAGVAFAGAIDQLGKESTFSFNHLKGIVGTSVGAISALMVCLKYTPNEITQKIANINLKEFADGGPLPLELIRLYQQHGIYRGDAVYTFVKSVLKEKTGNENATFGDLKNLGFIDLYVVTTKLFKINGVPDSKKKIFSYKKHFNTSIADIILASSAASPYFPSVTLKKVEKGKYIKAHDGYVYVDGGFSNNYDINFFDKPEYTSNANHLLKFFNPDTLGLALLNITQKDDATELKKEPTDSNCDFIKAIITTISSAYVKEQVLGNPLNNARTIKINKLGVKLNDFDINDEIKLALIESGKLAVKSYFHPEMTTHIEKKPANDPVIFAEKKVPNGSLFINPTRTRSKEESKTPRCSMPCKIL